MATTTIEITVSAEQYEDADDCLAAAADDIAEEYDLGGWDLAPRWANDDRTAIVLSVPADLDEITGRADDVEIGTQRAEWAWPFDGADEAYINAVGTGQICDELGVPHGAWDAISSLWCESFKRGYEVAHAEASRS